VFKGQNGLESKTAVSRLGGTAGPFALGLLGDASQHPPNPNFTP